jgi:hypothetical protein
VSEDWLVLFYRTDLSKYPVHVMEPSDFGVKTGDSTDPSMVSLVH